MLSRAFYSYRTGLNHTSYLVQNFFSYSNRPCPFKKEALKKRNLDPASVGGLSGLACKYCQAVTGGEEYCHKGQYFPCNFVGLSDSSFPQSLTQHVRSCPNVPVEVRCALDELTRLTAEYKVTTKRGSKKKFLKKVRLRSRARWIWSLSSFSNLPCSLDFYCFVDRFGRACKITTTEMERVFIRGVMIYADVYGFYDNSFVWHGYSCRVAREPLLDLMSNNIE